MKISSDFIPLFKQAGWDSNRKANLPSRIINLIPKEHPAIHILTEFSGLKVGRVGRGEQCAASDVFFGFIDDDIEEIEIWNDLLKTKLVGVAEFHHSHGELFIDSVGRSFSLNLRDTFCFEGENFQQAMQNLLFGRRSRPMLQPNQDSVMVYGDVFTADSPEITDISFYATESPTNHWT